MKFRNRLRLAMKARAEVLHNQRGQASIMIGMMMVTFMLFFAFVINTGMLVNAKINLQNAADMAAYSGAATQARHLNQISYINYEMRRQYKKFLFRYYVVGNMAQARFPRGGGTDQAYNWSPDGTLSYGVPAVCMIFNSKDNYCHLKELPEISIPKNLGPVPDQINATLIKQLEQIEQIRKDNCGQIGITNAMVLRLWLWNTDPELLNLQASVDEGAKKHINTIRGLALGLGLIPREILLRSRIETLKDYVNERHKENLTHSQVLTMQKSEDPAQHERSIQAFLSAFFTLGNHTFAAEDVVMDELMPDNLLNLEDVKVKFDTYAVTFPTDVNLTGPAACKPKIEADSLAAPLTIAVKKDPKTMTYYAVRLKAKAKILFSPFGDVTLKAYAAAQPFGSRIGPVGDTESEKNFLRDANLNPALGNSANATSLSLTKVVPNLPIREGDSSGVGKGWDTEAALGAYYAGFAPPGSSAPSGSLDQPAMNRAVQTAMAPNPYEGNRYNIPNDNGDSFVRNFDTNGVMSFWAPVFSVAKASQADSAVRSLVDDMMGESTSSTASLKAALQQSLTNYIGKLRTREGERIGPRTPESFNVFTMQDPLHVDGNPEDPITIRAEGLSLTDPTKIRTSWNGVLHDSIRKEGRVGYSVKIVSFDSLLRRTNKTDDASNWENSLAGDSEAQQDYSAIRH